MTPFTTIYDSFLAKIKDYSFLTMTQSDAEVILNKILILSIPKIARFLKTDISSRTTTGFSNTLKDLEVEIIATQMIVEWLSPALNNVELLKMVLNDKDLKTYSQANQIKMISELRDNMKDEVDSLVILLSYDPDDLEELNSYDDES